MAMSREILADIDWQKENIIETILSSSVSDFMEDLSTDDVQEVFEFINKVVEKRRWITKIHFKRYLLGKSLT